MLLIMDAANFFLRQQHLWLFVIRRIAVQAPWRFFFWGRTIGGFLALFPKSIWLEALLVRAHPYLWCTYLRYCPVVSQEISALDSHTTDYHIYAEHTSLLGLARYVFPRKACGQDRASLVLLKHGCGHNRVYRKCQSKSSNPVSCQHISKIEYLKAPLSFSAFLPIARLASRAFDWWRRFALNPLVKTFQTFKLFHGQIMTMSGVSVKV